MKTPVRTFVCLSHTGENATPALLGPGYCIVSNAPPDASQCTVISKGVLWTGTREYALASFMRHRRESVADVASIRPAALAGATVGLTC